MKITVHDAYGRIKYATDIASPLTTKGDIVTRDATQNIRLPVGNNGDVLTANSAASSGLNWAAPPGAPCCGRLTSISGTPVNTGDATAVGTLYFTPYQGNHIAVLDGSGNMLTKTFTELSLSLAGLTASTPYDIFIYDNAGTLTLEALAWTNDTTRATALTTVGGVLYKNGATTRRYLGTIRITAVTGQTEDSTGTRFIFNYYNRAPAIVLTFNTTSSWTYATAAFREQNAGTGQLRAQFVIGVADQQLLIIGSENIGSHAGGSRLAIGYDSTTVPSGSSVYTNLSGLISTYPVSFYATPAVGYHYFTLLEYSDGGGTTTYYGLSNIVQAIVWC